MLKNPNLLIILIFSFIIQNCGVISLWKNRNHNIRESYYNNGKLEYNSSYLNDKLDGPSYHYNQDETLISYAEYSNGSPHGIWKIFYNSGELKYSCSYFYGNKHGEEKFYHNNGQTQSLVKYEYGKEISEISRWKKNGELLY